VEGVIVEEGSVISMGVYIGQSTRIYDRETGEVHYGRVPAGSVVVSGNLPSKDGKYSLYCAVIVKKSMPKRVVKSASTNCCAPSTKSYPLPIRERVTYPAFFAFPGGENRFFR
jgi:2,3,4,5-tetrahydropyridine-2-carboxylate N-succinyltransferase